MDSTSVYTSCLAWPVERNGLLFSIVNRSDFGKEYGIYKGQLRKLTVKETYPYSQLKNYSVRILFVGSLKNCQIQFSEYGASSEFAVKFSNKAIVSSKVIIIFQIIKQLLLLIFIVMYHASPIANRLRKTVEEKSYFKHNKTRSKQLSNDNIETTTSSITSATSSKTSLYIVDRDRHDQEQDDFQDRHDQEQDDDEPDEPEFYNPDESTPLNLNDESEVEIDQVLSVAMASVSVVTRTPLTMTQTNRGFPRAHFNGFYYVIARKNGTIY